MTTKVKWYSGRRDRFSCQVWVHEEGKQSKKLPIRTDLRCHSPTGMEWGYNGSGPAQLALAILADYLGDDREALNLYHTFEVQVIAKLRGDTFTIGSADIDDFVSLPH